MVKSIVNVVVGILPIICFYSIFDLISVDGLFIHRASFILLIYALFTGFGGFSLEGMAVKVAIISAIFYAFPALDELLYFYHLLLCWGEPILIMVEGYQFSKLIKSFGEYIKGATHHQSKYWKGTMVLYILSGVIAYNLFIHPRTDHTFAGFVASQLTVLVIFPIVKVSLIGGKKTGYALDTALLSIYTLFCSLLAICYRFAIYNLYLVNRERSFIQDMMDYIDVLSYIISLITVVILFCELHNNNNQPKTKGENHITKKGSISAITTILVHSVKKMMVVVLYTHLLLRLTRSTPTLQNYMYWRIAQVTLCLGYHLIYILQDLLAD
eukprot:TRINITY_DN10638_c0_g1_i1.p1 TRINITY_DN10638_c0_g1~~TRINITY_DN10638_c0_g1_i1.p1  ORF type:complete len:326 (-),score=11.58 TRINITY_DN10638_c0_g1_i1:77-1054(-)